MAARPAAGDDDAREKGVGGLFRSDALWRSAHRKKNPRPLFYSCACCDTFNKMPMPIRLTSSDEPPALTNGNGMPLVGINPRTTLMFTRAWTAIIVVSPTARNAPK